MGWWSRLLGRDDAAPVATPPAADPGWRSLPPIQRVAAGVEPVAQGAGFSGSLATWRNPGLLGEMVHGLDGAAPSGSVVGLVELAPGVVAFGPRLPAVGEIRSAEPAPDVPRNAPATPSVVRGSVAEPVASVPRNAVSGDAVQRSTPPASPDAVVTSHSPVGGAVAEPVASVPMDAAGAVVQRSVPGTFGEPVASVPRNAVSGDAVQRLTPPVSSDAVMTLLSPVGGAVTEPVASVPSDAPPTAVVSLMSAEAVMPPADVPRNAVSEDVGQRTVPVASGVQDSIAGPILDVPRNAVSEDVGQRTVPVLSGVQDSIAGPVLDVPWNALPADAVQRALTPAPTGTVPSPTEGRAVAEPLPGVPRNALPSDAVQRSAPPTASGMVVPSTDVPRNAPPVDAEPPIGVVALADTVPPAEAVTPIGAAAREVDTIPALQQSASTSGGGPAPTPRRLGLGAPLTERPRTLPVPPSLQRRPATDATSGVREMTPAAHAHPTQPGTDTPPLRRSAGSDATAGLDTVPPTDTEAAFVPPAVPTLAVPAPAVLTPAARPAPIVAVQRSVPDPGGAAVPIADLPRPLGGAPLSGNPDTRPEPPALQLRSAATPPRRVDPPGSAPGGDDTAATGGGPVPLRWVDAHTVAPVPLQRTPDNSAPSLPSPVERGGDAPDRGVGLLGDRPLALQAATVVQREASAPGPVPVEWSESPTVSAPALAPPAPIGVGPVVQAVRSNPGSAAVAAGVAHRAPDGSVVFGSPPDSPGSNAPPVQRLGLPAMPSAANLPARQALPSAALPLPALPLPALPSPALPTPAPTPALPPEPAGAADTPGLPTATPPAAVAPAAAAAPGAPALPPTDELVRRLFDPLAARLKAELRLDRERAGFVTDMRR